MNFRITLFMVLLITVTVQGQEVACGWYGNKTLAERNAMFPFDQSEKILLISFIVTSGPSVVVLEDGTIVQVTNENVDELNMKYLKSFTFSTKEDEDKYYATEIIELGKAQIEVLSNFLFNYKSKEIPDSNALSMTNCYIPRNAVLFFGENDSIISVLEICFECRQAYFSPDPYQINRLNYQENCLARTQVLRDFFKNNGIRYGVEE